MFFGSGLYVNAYNIEETAGESDFMAPIRKQNKLQSAMTQFSYQHRRLDSQLTKIHKNADELAKMLGSLDNKKSDKNGK